MSERAYVVGDLHLGAGPADPLEDFFDDALFAQFCARIASPTTTLILNGDIIDFAQIPPFDVPKPSYLLWPERVSLAKLEVALAAHPGFFAGLAALLAAGGRVQFLIGNHDLDMCFHKVQWRMWDALGRPPTDRLGFHVGPYRYHGVHVEHGHRFTPENCPRDPELFCYDHGGEQYLERVWGTDFMLRFYNDLERSHPYADNVKPMKTVVWHGLKQGWIGARELVRLFLFLKDRGVSWRGLASAYLDEPPPLDPADAAAAFDDPAWKQVVLDRAEADPAGFAAELAAGLAELPRDERALASSPHPVDLIEPAPRGGATLGLFRDDREHRAARDHLAQPGVTHVVFGHTHEVVDGDELTGDLKGRLYNYGTWLPSLDLKDGHVAAKIARDGLTLDLLKDKRLYRADRRAVRIDADPTFAATVRLVTPDDP